VIFVVFVTAQSDFSDIALLLHHSAAVIVMFC